MPKPNISLVVEYTVKKDYWDPFLAVIREHAAGTLAEDKDCLQFDVLVPTEPGDRVFLYERYRDEDAYQAHTKTPRLASVRDKYAHMLADRRIVKTAVG